MFKLTKVFKNDSGSSIAEVSDNKCDTQQKRTLKSAISAFGARQKAALSAMFRKFTSTRLFTGAGQEKHVIPKPVYTGRSHFDPSKAVSIRVGSNTSSTSSSQSSIISGNTLAPRGFKRAYHVTTTNRNPLPSNLMRPKN